VNRLCFLSAPKSTGLTHIVGAFYKPGINSNYWEMCESVPFEAAESVRESLSFAYIVYRISSSSSTTLKHDLDPHIHACQASCFEWLIATTLPGRPRLKVSAQSVAVHLSQRRQIAPSRCCDSPSCRQVRVSIRSLNTFLLPSLPGASTLSCEYLRMVLSPLHDN